jgi:glycosyltransferase involved in cell wall biosynthesis
VLLEAMALAAPQMERDWELLIIGGGPLRDDLEHRAMRLGVSERVRFLGFLDNPYPLLASSDVFVHTARWEGFGLVIAEAMALGIPVIATSCAGGPSEILGNGRYGILAPPEDPESIAEALIRAASDEALMADLSERGVRRVAEYEPEAVAATAIDLLKELR